DRGNLEAQVFMLAAGYVVCMDQSKEKWAAPLLGAAVASKFYPAIFVFSYVREGKSKEAFRALAWTLIWTVVGFMMVKSTVAEVFGSLEHNKENFTQIYIYSAHEGIQHNASLWAFFHLMTRYYFTDWELTSVVDWAARSAKYSILTGVLFSFSVWAALFTRLVFWKRVMILTLAMVMLPQMSGDYRLLYYLFPMTYFFRADEEVQSDYFFALVFGLLFIPKTYFSYEWDITSNVLFNAPIEFAAFSVLAYQAVLNRDPTPATELFAGWWKSLGLPWASRSDPRGKRGRT
ncbi:MAG: glycosyltransferase 87 family protein, partial [Bdellovibrionota bacterium]